MNIPNHTPLPWHVSKKADPDSDGLTVESDFGLVCRFPEESDPENIKNAEFVALACNSHAALVAALKGIRTAQNPSEMRQALHNARAALRLAKGWP